MISDIFSDRVRGLISKARSVYVSGCAAEISALPDLFDSAELRDATVTGIFTPLINHRSYADRAYNRAVRTFLLTRALKDDMASGLVDFCPWRYTTIDRWVSAPERFDTAVVMLSPPDANGMCSLGVQADFFPSFHGNVETIVGFINPNLPATAGHHRIPYASLAVSVDYDVALPEMVSRPADAVSEAIARYIADRVPDGATIQLGTGQLPSEVLIQLAGHRNLTVHTGVVDDNIMRLEQQQALSRDVPIVTGTAIGTKSLYQAIGDHKRFALKAVADTHAYGNIAGAKRFTAINSVLQVDLLGQVSGEAIGGRIAASPGGLPEFSRGAQDSPDGQSILAVRAGGATGRHEGIVPIIDNPAIITNGAADAHIFVTEYGVADVRDLSMDKRAEAIIGIAPPNSRDRLAHAWREMRRSFFDRGAPDLHFAVESASSKSA